MSVSHLAVWIADHDVVGLEVPVDDAGAVHVAHRRDELREEEAHPHVVHLVQELGTDSMENFSSRYGLKNGERFLIDSLTSDM